MPPTIKVLEEHSSSTPSDRGFIRIRRLVLQTELEDGTRTQPYSYDVADRDHVDGVVIVLHSSRHTTPDDPFVCIRAALRPPLALRVEHSLVVPDPSPGPQLWELPAGMIERGTTGIEGVHKIAAKETHEEVGLTVDPSAFQPLGAPVFLSPGLLAEKIHFARAEVDHTADARPSATETVELGAQVLWLPLSEALQRAASGALEDCKTELGLRRLRAWLDANKR